MEKNIYASGLELLTISPNSRLNAQRKRESSVLTGAGLPGNVRELELGQATYLIYYLAREGYMTYPFPLLGTHMNEVWKAGYDWRDNEEIIKCFERLDTPHLELGLALYLDALVRLNQIHNDITRRPSSLYIPTNGDEHVLSLPEHDLSLPTNGDEHDD